MTGLRPELGGLRFRIQTLGCQMNENDSERMAGYLVDAGAVPADSIENADIVVVNTCAVRAKSEDKLMSFLGRIRVLKKRRPLLLGVSGCVAQLRKGGLLGPKTGVDFVIGPDQIHRLAAVAAESALQTVIATSRTRIWAEDRVAPLRESAVSGFVTIMEGCDNFCAYCVVPFTRGREKFRPFEAILTEIADLASRGYVEIQFLGQNVNSYRDPATGRDFSELLRAAAAVEGPVWIRFITSHPKNFSAALAETMASTPKICRQIHLPIQSGSSEVLSRMKRGYSREDYLDRVRLLRALMPDIRLSTDIIVGYPGETEVEFRETLSLLEEIQFANIFSFRYSPRPLTAAARLADDVALDVKRRRLTEVQALQKEIQTAFHRSLVGRRERVLGTSRSKKDPAFFAGRNESYHVVNFKSEDDAIGRFVEVEITSAGPYSLRGRVVDPPR